MVEAFVVELLANGSQLLHVSWLYDGHNNHYVDINTLCLAVCVCPVGAKRGIGIKRFLRTDIYRKLGCDEAVFELPPDYEGGEIACPVGISMVFQMTGIDCCGMTNYENKVPLYSNACTD
jgi:hypothetical protein